MSYAEQNRQLLSRYGFDQCILVDISNKVFKALQAGETIGLKHYYSITSCATYIFIALLLIIFTVISFVITEVSSTENGISLEGPQALLLLASIGFMLISVGFFIAAYFLGRILPRIRALNRLWREGRLLIAQSVVLGEPRDSDYHYGVTYEFIAPDGQHIAGQRDTDRVEAHAKSQPIMLMLYKSPKDYMVL